MPTTLADPDPYGFHRAHAARVARARDQQLVRVLTAYVAKVCPFPVTVTYLADPRRLRVHAGRHTLAEASPDEFPYSTPEDAVIALARAAREAYRALTPDVPANVVLGTD